jgi:SAM-dependent methyltransferase
MALTQTIVGLLLRMRRAGLFDFGTARLLDLGEQNLYGDVRPQELPAIARALKLPEARVAEIDADVARLVAAGGPLLAFDLAKRLYRIVFDCETYRAIDLNGTDIAWRHDLNAPLPVAETFDVVTNFGTSEHVFDQAQLFRSMHALTRPGGFMLHAVPSQGGPDHGFYNYHPTFFHDLAAANSYRLPLLVLTSPGDEKGDRLDTLRDRDAFPALVARGELAREAGLFVALQKPFEPRDFRVPLQGYYAGELSAAGTRAWEQRR